MILTMTLNPCVSRTLHVARLRTNYFDRTNRVELIAGGKGTNVARVLRTLGVPVKAFALLGGETGKLYARLVKEEDIPLVPAWIDVPTRTETFILENNTNRWIGVLEEAPMVPNTEIDAVRDKMIASLKGARYAVISGSVPSVNLAGVYRQVLEAAHARGIVTALDTYGRALADAIAAGPFMAKPNRKECEALVGHRIRNAKSAKRALAFMHQHGVRLAVITVGRRGFYAGYEGTFYAVEAPKVREVNPLGCGDAVTAGLLFGLSNDLPIEQALRWGAAAGAANATVWAAGTCTADQVRALLEQPRITKL